MGTSCCIWLETEGEPLVRRLFKARADSSTPCVFMSLKSPTGPVDSRTIMVRTRCHSCLARCSVTATATTWSFTCRKIQNGFACLPDIKRLQVPRQCEVRHQLLHQQSVGLAWCHTLYLGIQPLDRRHLDVCLMHLSRYATTFHYFIRCCGPPRVYTCTPY